MNVICAINDLAMVRSPDLLGRLRRFIHIDGPISGLTVGRLYPVQAVEQRSDGSWWYYLHPFEDIGYPHPHPAEFFTVVDASIPAGWCVGAADAGDGLSIKRLTFPAWAHDDRFYEHLVDEKAEYVQAYRHWRQR